MVFRVMRVDCLVSKGIEASIVLEWIAEEFYQLRINLSIA